MSNAEPLVRAEEILGHHFDNPSLLRTALTHSSIANTRLESNERLEFLGDAVLGLVVCEELFRRHPDWLEGDLTKVKSAVVSRRTCAQVSDEMGFAHLLSLGNGIEAQHALPVSVRAAVFEALIGAMLLEGGFDLAKSFILRCIRPHLDRYAASIDQDNYKSLLQQHVQRFLGATPHYDTLDEQGPDHSKCFEVCVVVSGRRYPSAWGASKKDAEQKAARRALEVLEQSEPFRSGDPPQP